MDGDLQDPPELLPLFIAKWLEGYEVISRSGATEGRFSEKAGLILLLPDFERFERSGYSFGQRRFLPHGPLSCRCSQAPSRAMRFMRGCDRLWGFAHRIRVRAGLAGPENRNIASAACIGYRWPDKFQQLSSPAGGLTWVLTICVALLLAWVVSRALYSHEVPQGWASTLVTALFMGSIQLFTFGIIGEYIRLIFLETKGRPTYIVRDTQAAPNGH